MPTNMTGVGGYIEILTRSLLSFGQRSSGWGNLKKAVVGNSMDLVYFTSAMSCDSNPVKLLSSIIVEWLRAGGSGLYHKDIQAFNTSTPFVLFYLHTNIMQETITAEFQKIMEEGILLLDDGPPDENYTSVLTVPTFTLQKRQPKLPGLDPREYNKLKLTTKQTNSRRVWHLEVETQHQETFNKQIKACKDLEVFGGYWGDHMLISETVEYDSTQGNIDRVLKTLQKHTNFQVSLTVVQLYGISNLDHPVPLQVEEGAQSEGKLTLRQVMTKHVRTQDGESPLFASIRQGQAHSPVEAVIPNKLEAEGMIGSINQQTPAFLKHYLVSRGLAADFISRLVVASCDPVLAGTMNSTRWDNNKQDIILEDESWKEASLAVFENAPWYVGISKLQVSETKGKYTAPEALFNLDEAQSVTTLHAKNDGKRAAAPKAAARLDSEDEDDGSNKDSASSNSKSDAPLEETAGIDGSDGTKTVTWKKTNYQADPRAVGGG